MGNRRKALTPGATIRDIMCRTYPWKHVQGTIHETDEALEERFGWASLLLANRTDRSTLLTYDSEWGF